MTPLKKMAWALSPIAMYTPSPTKRQNEGLDTCTSMYFEGIELPFALQMSVVWWYFGASI